MIERLADKAAMRIMTLSRAIRARVEPKAAPAAAEPMPAPAAPAPMTPPPIDAAGVAPLEQGPVDMGVIANGGDVFNAMTSKLGE